MKTKMKIGVFASLLVLFAVVLGFTLEDSRIASVQTQTTEITRVEHVSYGDLNMNSTTGVEILYERLQYAARNVCGPQPPRSAHANVHWNTCYREALDDAVGRIGNAQLTTIHRIGNYKTQTLI